MAKPTKSTSKLSEAAGVPAMTSTQKREQMKWQAEDAIRTLTRAEEIKKDKNLMGHVKRHAREQVKTMQKVCK